MYVSMILSIRRHYGRDERFHAGDKRDPDYD